jgi:antirestriction protein ArdC
MANEKIYEMVTNKIVEQLEKGVVPWRKPWVNGGAVSWNTQKAYRGINTMLLDAGEWATFKQIKEAGGKVKKGAKSSFVIFFKWIEKEDKDGEVERIPLLRFYNVFEINTQVEGLESKRGGKGESFDNDPIKACEEIVKGYLNAPSYTYERNGAWYRPSADQVNVPPMSDFTSAEEFYNTLFHEMTHSTGHASRLNREGVTGQVNFGSQTYSKEELVAEMGASFLMGTAGIEDFTLENTASYIDSWLRQLKKDKTLLVRAAGLAQRAADHILNIKFDN